MSAGAGLRTGEGLEATMSDRDRDIETPEQPAPEPEPPAPETPPLGPLEKQKQLREEVESVTDTLEPPPPRGDDD